MGAQSAEPEQKLEFRFFRELRIRENSGDANSFRKLWSKSLSSAATVPLERQQCRVDAIHDSIDPNFF